MKVPTQPSAPTRDPICGDPPHSKTTIAYKLCRADRAGVPVGKLAELFHDAPELLKCARGMAIELMRQNRANLFRR